MQMPSTTPLSAVIAAIVSAYPDITARDVAAHSDIAPGRKKRIRGPAFDWLRLYDGLNAQLS